MNCPTCNRPLNDPDTGQALAPLDAPTRASVDRRRRDEETGVFVSKFTPEVKQRIIESLAAGNTFTDAAVYAGISRATLNNWFRDGRVEEAPEELREFMEQVDQACAQAKVHAVTALHVHGTSGQARALEFWLERRYPGEYGRRQRVDHGNADGQAFMVATPTFDPELLSLAELETLKALLAKATPQQDTHPIIEGTRA